MRRRNHIECPDGDLLFFLRWARDPKHWRLSPTKPELGDKDLMTHPEFEALLCAGNIGEAMALAARRQDRERNTVYHSMFLKRPARSKSRIPILNPICSEQDQWDAALSEAMRKVNGRGATALDLANLSISGNARERRKLTSELAKLTRG
jgi:hypothetical protein